MPFELVTIPCLTDNYAFLLHDSKENITILVDAPESEPVLEVLKKRDWHLNHIILTHHHWDHVDGLTVLQEHFSPRILGAHADQHRLPPLDYAAKDGEIIEFGSHKAKIHDVSGHTIGHIAIHFEEEGILFTGDSLMALGCGRLFEGSPEQMWQSMQKLLCLPDDTIVCSGHEYTENNGKFAITIEPENQDLILRINAITSARSAGKPTVPSQLALEKSTNPFLRPDSKNIRHNLGMNGVSDAAVFAEIRRRKDNF